jgi:hypothetical protein
MGLKDHPHPTDYWGKLITNGSTLSLTHVYGCMPKVCGPQLYHLRLNHSQWAQRMAPRTDDRQKHLPYRHSFLESQIDLFSQHKILVVKCLKKLILSRAIFGEFLSDETLRSSVNLLILHDE